MNEQLNISLAEQKEIMLRILVDFANFCELNKLNYHLDAGTLIGAVRHNGFIPWDDDIDVGMPRKDFDTFIELMRQQNDRLSEHIILEYPENTIYPFLKIADDRTVLVEFPNKYPMDCSVYIDVFAKDGIKDSSLKSKWLCKKSEMLGLIHWFNHFSIFAWKEKGNVIQKIIAFFGRVFFKNSNWAIYVQNRLIQRNAKKHPVEGCKYVTTLTNGEFHKIAPKECFDSYIMSDFEGKKFKIPVGYDRYLHCLYKGNYMQLPPEDKRVHHDTIVCWKSEEAKKDYYQELSKISQKNLLIERDIL